MESLEAHSLSAYRRRGCTPAHTKEQLYEISLGFGSTASGQNPVNFNWQSSDNVSGTMNATLSDGKTFTAQYFQITTDTTIDNLPKA